MKFTNKDRSNLFWYLLVPSLSIITLFISLSPWFFELIATPVGQVFTGINRWSGDYFTYLSYVELGRRGELGAQLLATTLPQNPVFVHLAHTLIGYIFGHLLNLNSIISYHIGRSLFGLIFVLLTFVFFYKISGSKKISIISFLLVFFVGGFPKLGNINPLLFERHLGWLQEQNIISRATGPLHYNAGFIFFILSVIWFFSDEKNLLKKVLIFGLLLNLTLVANPFAYLILGLSFGVYIIIVFIWRKSKTFLAEVGLIAVSFFISLPLFFYNQHLLSTKPWGNLGGAPKFYVVTHLPINFFETIMSIGPIFFLGIAGIVFLLFFQKAKIFNLFLISWLIVQFFLFFFGDFVRLDPLRSFNGLYYLPLAYFSTLFINKLTKNFYKQLLIVTLLMILTLPNYYLSYKEQLFAFTDFKSFFQFTYPTIKQVAAFKFLEKNTPTSSSVLALYEASSLIIGFSGNSTEVNMDQNLKMPFYTNQLTDKQAKDFLKNNHFQYVYFGYQEKSVGGSMDKYPFLKKIFSNEEVKIYQVL